MSAHKLLTHRKHRDILKGRGKHYFSRVQDREKYEAGWERAFGSKRSQEREDDGREDDDGDEDGTV